MNAAEEIKKMRDELGMTKREFANHLGIPLRTIEDWEACRRTPPDYIPRLISYQLKYEKMTGENTSKEIDDES